MNFLAHSFLSFSDEQMVGNLIGDFVKNKDKNHLSQGVIQGVTLHRAIDTYTDSHPKVREAKTVFSPVARLYAGAFVDVVFDYFLANDPQIYTAHQWKQHSQRVYDTLYRYYDQLPERFRPLLSRMKEDDWLYNYRHDWGIDYSLRNVLHKAQYLADDTPVFRLFLDHKLFLGDCFQAFFPDLQKFAGEMFPLSPKGVSDGN